MNESLKRSNEVQKFVLESCQHLPEYLQLLEKSKSDATIFETNYDELLKLGWFLRGVGQRFDNVVMLATALLFCNSKSEGQLLSKQGIDVNILEEIKQS